MYSYVGNCVNCFDADGVCCVTDLPYSDASDFACDLDGASELDAASFFESVSMIGLPKRLVDAEISFYTTPKDVFILYDEEMDVHYFFVKQCLTRVLIILIVNIQKRERKLK